MTVTAVLVSHANQAGLRDMLGQLIYQTRKPDEILVMASGYTHADLDHVRDDFQGHAAFHACETHNDWGHQSRVDGMGLATGDALGWFNDDDRYDPRYLEKLAAALEKGANVAYCDWHPHAPTDCVFATGRSTSGNYLVQRELALQAGYKSREYDADGRFIEEINKRHPAVQHVQELLYWHNGGIQPDPEGVL